MRQRIVRFLKLQRRKSRRNPGRNRQTLLERLESRLLLTTQPVAAWEFDDGAGSITAQESSGNAHHLSLSGITSSDWVAPVAENSANTHALHFGTSAKLGSVSGISTLPAESIAFWIKPDQTISPSASQSVVAELDSRSDDNLSGVIIALGDSTGALTGESITLINQDTMQMTAITDVTRPEKSWLHVAFVWNALSNRYDAYLDGELKSVVATSQGHVDPISVQNNIRIGQRSYPGDSLPFAGAIDDFRLYNGSLTADAVRDLATPLDAKAVLDATTWSGSTTYTTTASYLQARGDELLPVDVNRAYQLSGWARSGNDGGSQYDGNNLQYFGFISYDAQGNEILPQHVHKFLGAMDTTLSEDLVPGAPEIRLTNATGWSNSGSGDNRIFAWYGTDPQTGVTFQDYGYTRNLLDLGAQGAWDAGAINFETNTIQLRSPWAGPFIPAGSAVRNAANFDGTYNYLATVKVPNSWMHYSGTISGLQHPENGEENKFRPGTVAIRPLILANFNGQPNNRITWRDVEWTYARPWQNRGNPFDTNASGDINPFDKLVLINRYNEVGYGPLAPPVGSVPPPPYYDVNGDDAFTEADITFVQNALDGTTTRPPTRFSPGDQVTIYSPTLSVNGPLLFDWNQTSGVPVTIVVEPTQQASFEAPIRSVESLLRFEQIASDGDSSIHDSVDIAIEAATSQLRVDIEVVNLAGQPVQWVAIGQEFRVNVYVEDIRPIPLGIVSAYLDLAYDTQFISVVAGPEPTAVFLNAVSGNASTPGLLDEVGGFVSSIDPLGRGRKHLFSALFTATNSGYAVFATNAADDQVKHATTLFGWNNTLSPDFIHSTR